VRFEITMDERLALKVRVFGAAFLPEPDGIEALHYPLRARSL
jgi:hypothetical protein